MKITSGHQTAKLSSVEHNTKPSVVSSASAEKSDPRFHVAETFCERIVTVFSLLCRSKSVIESFRSQVRKHLVQTDLIFFRRAKNFVCWFRAYYLRNELPDVDGYRMVGPFRRWAFPRLKHSVGREHNARNDYLWNSFFLLKNCCLPVTDAKVCVELHGHFKSGPAPDTCKVSDVVEMVSNLRPLLQEIAVKVRIEYDKLLDPDAWVDMYPASNKASLETPQKRGGEAMDLYYGAFGKTIDLTLEATEWGFSGPLSPISDARKMHDVQNLWNPNGNLERRLALEKNVAWLPYVDTWGSLTHGYFDLNKPRAIDEWLFAVDELGLTWYIETPKWEPFRDEFMYEEFCYSDSYWDMVDWTFNSERPKLTVDFLSEGYDGTWITSKSYPRSRRVFREHVLGHVDDLPAYPMTKEEFDKKLKKPPNHQDGYSLEDSLKWEGPMSRIVAVKEPLKVRTIGVGEAAINFASTWFQKTVHSILQTYPAFHLLGEAPVVTLVGDLASNSAEPQGNLKAMSSDFQGASNKTPKLAREMLLEELHQFLPERLRRVNRFCNGDHLLIYNWSRWPKSMGKKPKKIQISRQGTQMGRKTSFPLLSLQVFGAFVMACRRQGIEKPLSELQKSVNVNGDDLLAFVSQDLHDQFWKCCESLQFTKSVGKSYFHEEYANINSQSYRCRLTASGWSVKKIGSLYCGLLMGQKKLATDVFDPTTVITALLDSCYDSKMESSVLKTFLGLHRHQIRAQAAGRNLFIPVGLGGCGQRKPRNWQSSVTTTQKVVASYLLSKGDLVLRQATDPVIRSAVLPIASREVWDVRGVPTYWEQVRTMQCGDGAQEVILSPDLWALSKDRDFLGFTGPLVKSKHLQNRAVRRVARPYPSWEPGHWSCPCCRTIMDEIVDTCSLCLIPRDRPMEIKIPIPQMTIKGSGVGIQVDELVSIELRNRSMSALNGETWNLYTEKPPIRRISLSRAEIYRIGG